MKALKFHQTLGQRIRQVHRLALIALFLVGLLFFPVSVYGQNSTAPGDTPENSVDTDTVSSTVAIRVEDEVITKEQFNNRVNELFEKYRKQAKKKGRKFKPEKVRAEIKNKVQKRMVSRLLVKVHAERSDITVPDTKVNKSWEESLKRVASEEQLLKRFGENVTPEEAKEKIRFQIKRTLFINKNLPKVTVTDTEVLEVYRKNRQQFQRVGKTRALKFIRRKIKEKKKNQASKVYIANLKKKSDVEINI